MRKVSAKHIQWLKEELPILENKDIVSPDTADKIKSYYAQHTTSSLHWAVMAFAVLGSLLIGCGIILLFAHNWDHLGRPARAALSFCPILIGAVLSVIALLRNGGSAFREAAGIFHSLAVGASIALIGQTYHIPSDLPAFFLTWALLILPLPFLLSSTGSFLVYLGLICSWSGAAQSAYGQAAGFWLLLIPALGKLTAMLKVQRYATDTLVSFFGVLFALLFAVGAAFERTVPGLWIVAYSAMLSGAALLGLRMYGDRDGWNNPPKLFGIIGIAFLAYLFTWTDMWRDIGWYHTRSGWHHKPWGIWIDSSITLLMLAGWLITAIKVFRRNSIETVTLAAFPVIGVICFILGCVSKNGANVLNAIIFNGFMLFYGVMYIALGCRNTRLRQLNGGMAVLSLLLLTRFFDAGFGFLARGMAFIILGVCFLTVNLVMARRKKQLEVSS